MKYLYLLVNFLTILIPFIFSFHPKLRFHKTWHAFFPAMLVTAFIFIVWDIFFTRAGVWGFNPDYVSGLYINNLPIEEVFFFVCIPYACVFTFHCLDLFIKRDLNGRVADIFTIILVFSLLVCCFIYRNNLYTFYTFLLLSLLLLFIKYVLRADWLSKFYIIYAILLMPFFIVNGILTGWGLDEPVVWYNPGEIIGTRLITIPIEDIFYGMALILMNVVIYKQLLKSFARRELRFKQSQINH